MKTIKQIADELKINKQKVARYIKKNNIHITLIESVIHIDDTEEKAIKEHFFSINKKNEVNQNHINEAVYNTLIIQIIEKDKQINALLEKLDQAQKLHLATLQEKNQLQIELKENKSVSLFKRLWKK